jgi:hypothetical protein
MALAYGNHLRVNPFLFLLAHSLKLCEISPAHLAVHADEFLFLGFIAVRANEFHNLRY